MKIDHATYSKRILRMARHRGLTLKDAQRPELRLWRDPLDRYVAFYAPFDHIRRAARLVIIGAPPGQRQVPIALTVYRDALLAGRSEGIAQRLAKEASAFEGMRSLISGWLDVLGVADMLSISGCSELWTRQRPLLHATSAVRYPTFKRVGEKLEMYPGRDPFPSRHPRLRDMVETLLGPELKRCPKAVIFPMGHGAQDAVRHLVHLRVVDEARCAFVLPHPSGSNSAQHATVRANRRALRREVARAWQAVNPS